MSNCNHKITEKYYSLDKILKKNCQYSMVIGERSNGKTFAGFDYGIKNWVNLHEQFAYVRRWKEDLVKKRADIMFDGMICDGEGVNRIEQLTNGEFNRVKHQSGKWYLCYHDDNLDQDIVQDEPFCIAFALSDMEHDKSTSYPNITTIIFDEFLSRKGNLDGEFVVFCNLLSTIIRRRTNVKIFMFANTVNKYSPYFKEMGLKHVQQMKAGDIDVYEYGSSGLRVALEYSDTSVNSKKESDVYFAFDNPSLAMITGGAWEIDIYPHCPRKFLPKDIIFYFFIIFDDNILQCEIVTLTDCSFLYIHEKTTAIKNTDKDIIFSLEYDPRPNHFRNIRRSSGKISQKIGEFFKNSKVFYQNNEVGEIVRNYLQFCASDKS